MENLTHIQMVGTAAILTLIVIFCGVAIIQYATGTHDPDDGASEGSSGPQDTPAAPSGTAGSGESSSAPVDVAPVASNRTLLIERCSDPMLWYAGLVGQEVPYICTYPGEGVHMSRELAGYRNIVKMCDARIVNKEA